MAFSESLFYFATVVFFFLSLVRATDVSFDSRSIKINGERKLVIAGSIHYPRSTPQMWPELIQKAKAGGLDTIETYIFWNAHEPRRREYNFEGNLNFVRFLKEVDNAGLYAILRIGPYVCAEWNAGGLPAWLMKIPGMEYRTDNKPFEDEMQTFTTLIVNMVKSENLLAPQGGPIILLQIENEYGNIHDQYGEAGKKYINWCAEMAESLNAEVPWIMCQQDNAPQPMINTCNGFYCDWFTPNNPNSPKMWTENWTGWFKDWEKPDQFRPSEDVANSVARFFQTNGTLLNYYMYHGGTNFGRTAGGWMVTSYDYDAPLDEFGHKRQPKWGHLRELHAALRMMEKALLHGDVKDTTLGNGVTVTKFSGANLISGCFITNKNQTSDASLDYEGTHYFVPAWSVSVLPACKDEVYNTAKIGVQTSVMTKKPNEAESKSKKMSWVWKPELIKDYVTGKNPSLTTDKLLEQVSVTADTSDYLWYSTSFDYCCNENMTLSVNSSGAVLYVFVNGNLVGSQHVVNNTFNFVFQHSVLVKKGKNFIALLSVTVGLKNYGAFFEKVPNGIVGGPVRLTGKNNATSVDLSNNQWAYKIGLDGEEKKIHLKTSNHGRFKWNSKGMPKNTPFTWYKATFNPPLGTDPVVVDLLGMGKGEAWVNGQSIGRYWPTMVANSDCRPCDYRQGYSQEHTCGTNCGMPTQRWYHVPRGFLKPGEPNALTLFEEAGGDPSSINFQTVVVGRVCGNVYEKKTLELTCPGSTISKIEFASFGNPTGTCGAFQMGSCEAPDTLKKVAEACVGKESCSLTADASLVGACPACGGGVIKKLAVQADCA